MILKQVLKNSFSSPLLGYLVGVIVNVPIDMHASELRIYTYTPVELFQFLLNHLSTLISFAQRTSR